MDRELRMVRPMTPIGEFARTPGSDATRVARVIQRPDTEPIPAEELARIRELDELGAQEHITGPNPVLQILDDELDEEPLIAPLSVESPVTTQRSLIPADVLEAIAREEAELLAEESQAEEEALADAGYDEPEWADADVIEGDAEVASEPVDAEEALELVRAARVFAQFPPDAQRMLVEGAVRHHLADRQAAFREGAGADSFFVVEHGVLEVLRVGPDSPELALMHVRDGDAFGLFGLLTQRVRAATVRAIGEATVLELRASRLDAVARTSSAARHALARFFKERLLENFLAVSPLFRNLDAVGRAALISHFEDRKAGAGEPLLSPGEVQDAIVIVTSGSVRLVRRDAGREIQLGKLHRGQYYGVVSALAGLPTRASVAATEPSTLCILPQKAFNEFVRGYPVLRNLPARLHEAGTQVERDLFIGDATALG